ncbi:MAG TPA: hypothetical protein VLD62_08380, partial [Acidimicrobiia bacterium]|nr:hypothetical protein [Acidimicrobiia bacterium]
MRDAGSLGDRPRVLVAIPYPSVQWVREYEWHDRHSRAEIELVVFEDTGVWETASSASLPITLLPKRASAVLESSAPDVVVIHGLVQPKAVRSIRRFCSRHGIPFVVRTDGNIVRETVRPFRHRVKRPLYRRVIRAASAIAVAGTQNRRFYESFTSADEVRHREVFLPFRLDIDSLDTIGPGSRSEARAHFGLEDSDTVVTVVSRVSSEKGIDLFVDAMDGLAGRARAAVGLIAGSGPQMEELGRRSRALG